jgi:hypothetical protein
VPVAVPIAGEEVNFYIAGTRFILAELQNRASEVRPRLVIPEARVKNAQRLAVKGAKLAAAKSLMMPYVLEEPFGRIDGAALAQLEPRLLLRAPLAVKVGRQ